MNINLKHLETHDQHYFLNRILILVILMIKSLLKKLMVYLDKFSALFSAP
jgi:hypothetical protein